MKRLSKGGRVRVRKALATAYFDRERDRNQYDGLSQTKVMSRIHSLGPLASKDSDLEVFGQFLWRVAPIACILILILTVVFTQIRFISDNEIAKVFMEDPSNFGLTSFLVSL